MKEYCTEIEWHSVNKKHNSVCGDTVLSKKIVAEGRVVTVLADGLGSGVKASVLSTLTTTMALRFISSDMNIKQAAEIIMKTLPKCSVRKIAYSTFLIIDTRSDGMVQIIEYSTPSSVVIRQNSIVPMAKKSIRIVTDATVENQVFYYSFKAQPGDRIVCYTDGVTQAGIGSKAYPLGWGESGVLSFIRESIAADATLSAQDLSRKIVEQARRLDEGFSQDDTTCVVEYFRIPRKLLLISGPPFEKSKDANLKTIVEHFEGKKIICGGTTAKILAREFDRTISLSPIDAASPVPPASILSGFDLVTEGCVTLTKVYEILSDRSSAYRDSRCAAGLLLRHLLGSDAITFVVGTKINEAHQNPEFPQNFDIRKNIVKKIAEVLENTYMKRVDVMYI